jgi:hypothetical protein
MKDMGLRIHTQIFLYLNKRRCQQSCHIFCEYKYRKHNGTYPQVVIGSGFDDVDKAILGCG